MAVHTVNIIDKVKQFISLKDNMEEFHLAQQSGMITDSKQVLLKPFQAVRSKTNDIKVPSGALKSLRILRDSNPHLKRKLKQSENDSDHIDEFLSYWNRYQNVVVVKSTASSHIFTGLNLGGLMTRIVDLIPFMESLAQNGVEDINMINLGGTDIPMKNLYASIIVGEGNLKPVLGSLLSLYMGGCAIAPQRGVNNLIQVLKLCSSVTTLDLRYNDFNEKDIENLESVLSASQVEVLHLEGNEIKCHGAAVIGTILSKTGSLKELYLGDNKIGPNGAKELARGLRSNSSLKKLYLESNYIGEEGAEAFRSVLMDQNERKCKVLEKLYFTNNGIGENESRKLGRALNSDSLIEDTVF